MCGCQHEFIKYKTPQEVFRTGVEIEFILLYTIYTEFNQVTQTAGPIIYFFMEEPLHTVPKRMT